MFDPNSRYNDVEDATLTVADPESGSPRTVVYKRRRFVPPAEDFTTLVEHTVQEGDRLDRIAAGYLGEGTQSWRICDANQAIHPEELTQEPGHRVTIATPNQ